MGSLYTMQQQAPYQFYQVFEVISLISDRAQISKALDFCMQSNKPKAIF